MNLIDSVMAMVLSNPCFCKKHVHAKKLTRDALHIFKMQKTCVSGLRFMTFKAVEILWGAGLFGERTLQVSVLGVSRGP